MVKLIFLFFISISSFASLVEARDYIPPMPSDLSKVDIYLQTVGRGEDIYMTGGHSLLRVVDNVAGSDVVFNWGVFDFNDDGFALKFLRGNINYRMAAYSMRDNLAMYHYERRTVIQERINLTLKQKEAMMRSIISSAQPENLYFRYHYYFTNCATKVRDRMDDAVGGKITEHFKGRMSTRTLRDAVHESFSNFPFLGTTLEILMNSDLEVLMTAMQDMFLPLHMQTYLQELPQYNDNGDEIPGTKLLTERTPIMTYPEPKALPYRGSQLLFVFLSPLLMISMTALMRGKVVRHWPYRLAGAVSLFWGCFSAFFGVVMLLVWFWSEHVHGRHSANLLLFWPVDFFWIYLGYRWLRYGVAHQTNRFNAYRLWIFAHIFVLVVGVVLYLLGVILQDVSNIWAELGPITMLLSGFTLSYGLKQSVEDRTHV